jgi:general stress protein CsbA
MKNMKPPNRKNVRNIVLSNGSKLNTTNNVQQQQQQQELQKLLYKKLIQQKINQQRITSNIPYLTLFLLLISFLLYLFVSISKGYFIHFFIYLIGIISISILFFLKRKYDLKKT